MFSKSIILSLTVILAWSPLASAVTIFTEDFSTPSTAGPQGTLGGQFAFLNFGDIVVSQNTDVSGGVVEVTPDSDFDGIAIAIDPANFTEGVGLYDFSFDILSLELNSTMDNIGMGSAEAAVFLASGFDFVDPNNGILISTFAPITGGVTSSSSQVTISDPPVVGNFTTVGTNNLSFQYDGTSTVVIFLGSNGGGFPDPTIQFDNIEVSFVPEPSSLLLVMSSAIFLFRRRRS